MTTAAWITLSITWSVIAFFTTRFFVAVIASGRRDRERAAP